MVGILIFMSIVEREVTRTMHFPDTSMILGRYVQPNFQNGGSYIQDGCQNNKKNQEIGHFQHTLK